MGEQLYKFALGYLAQLDADSTEWSSRPNMSQSCASCDYLLNVRSYARSANQSVVGIEGGTPICGSGGAGAPTGSSTGTGQHPEAEKATPGRLVRPVLKAQRVRAVRKVLPVQAARAHLRCSKPTTTSQLRHTRTTLRDR
jgi:hypothetical protein